VDALLSGVKIDCAVDPRADQLLLLPVPDAHCLVDTGHACARKSNPHVRGGRLEVGEKLGNVGHGERRATVAGPDEQAKSGFAELVSLACHDLRTPLATVHGFARTLRRIDGVGETALRYAEMIAAASGQLAELIETLALVARIEAGPPAAG
jgi:signal transduction histidine kinase